MILLIILLQLNPIVQSGDTASMTTNFSMKSSDLFYQQFEKKVFYSSATNDYFKVMNESNDTMTEYVIKNASVPIVFGAIEYHWDNHFSPVKTHYFRIRCNYAITELDNELQNVVYANNSTPQNLTFDCIDVACCGLECCSTDSFSTTVVAIVFFSAAIFFLVICGISSIFINRRSTEINPLE